MLERAGPLLLVLFSIYYLNAMRINSSTARINIAGSQNVYRLAGSDPITTQSVQVSVALYVSRNISPAQKQRLTGQLENTSVWLRGRSIKGSGYNVNLRVVRIVEEQHFAGANITYDNFDEICNSYVKKTAQTVPGANVAIVATFDQHIVSPRSEYILGMSNNKNCMVYSATADDCGLVLFHELMHTVFKLDHIESCEKYVAGRINVVAAQYQTYLCDNVTHANLFSGLECDYKKDFVNSRYSPVRGGGDTEKNDSADTLLKLPDLVTHDDKWGAWTPWKHSGARPFRVSERTRQCLLDSDPYATCATGERVQTNISIDACEDQRCVSRLRSLAAADRRKPAAIGRNCSTYNGCLYLCDYDSGTIVHAQSGTLCGDGICDSSAVCRMLDTTMMVSTKNRAADEGGRNYKRIERLELRSPHQFNFAHLLAWIYETRIMLRFGPPVLKLNKKTLTCFGEAVCQQVELYLRANLLAYKTLASSTTDKLVMQSSTTGACVQNEYVCEKYVFNYQYGKKFSKTIKISRK